jgi:hypothetical protein
LLPSSLYTLKLEETPPSGLLLPTYQITRRHIPESNNQVLRDCVTVALYIGDQRFITASDLDQASLYLDWDFRDMDECRRVRVKCYERLLPEPGLFSNYGSDYISFE